LGLRGLAALSFFPSSLVVCCLGVIMVVVKMPVVEKLSGGARHFRSLNVWI
jgi:hypothetical protein